MDDIVTPQSPVSSPPPTPAIPVPSVDPPPPTVDPPPPIVTLPPPAVIPLLPSPPPPPISTSTTLSSTVAPCTPERNMPKHTIYAKEVEATFSPSTVGKWIKSSLTDSHGKSARELVVCLADRPLEAAKERIEKILNESGGEPGGSMPLIGEISKTLQLLVLQRPANRASISKTEITKCLFSTYPSRCKSRSC